MKVLGYGDNVGDDYIEQKIIYPGGNALNFSYYMKELGANSHFLGYIANDLTGKHIQNILTEMNIDYSHCPIYDNKYTELCAIVLKGNDRTFVGTEKRDILDTINYDETYKEYMQTFDLVHTGCYVYKEKDIEKFDLPNTLLSYDFSNEKEYLEPSYYAPICKKIDFALFSSDFDIEKTKEIMQAMHKQGVKSVLATRGIKGQIFLHEGKYYFGDIKKVDAIDTCGAGDSFVSAFLYSLLKDGYRKGGNIDEKMIENAFLKAKEFSANNCLRKGAIGHGIKY